MPSPEPARHALYARLEEVLGHEHAETLMTHLPPEPSDRLATRADIDRLELATRADIERLDGRFERLDGRFDGLEDRFERLEDRFDQLTVEVREMHGVMRDQLRTYTVTTVGSMTALTGIFAVILTIIR